MVWGSRVAGIMGKKGVEAWGFDSPPQFRRRGPAGVGAAAMVAADDSGHGRREQVWGKGREGRKEPSAPPTLGRGDTKKRGDGSGGGGSGGAWRRR